MDEAKPFKVGKRLVYEGWKEVKSNKGSAGIDGIGVEEYERKLHNNLYKLWNRMSSGSQGHGWLGKGKCCFLRLG